MVTFWLWAAAIAFIVRCCFCYVLIWSASLPCHCSTYGLAFFLFVAFYVFRCLFSEKKSDTCVAAEKKNPSHWITSKFVIFLSCVWVVTEKFLVAHGS
jgi:hypothetical protein